MSVVCSGLFVPGWGAPAALYRPGLPDGWRALELPAFRESRGRLEPYLERLRAALALEERPVALAGHSMGGALAMLAALEQPQLVERLILLSPAGLMLEKRLQASALTFVGQLLRRCYPPSALWRMTLNTVSAPLAALRLARLVHDLDLTGELEKLRALGIPTTVVACSGDRLTTCTHCRQLASLLGAGYRELDARDGHIWPVTQPEILRRELTLAP
jgi:pimeloyl-ACP methyl ester carboxylesterase